MLASPSGNRVAKRSQGASCRASGGCSGSGARGTSATRVRGWPALVRSQQKILQFSGGRFPAAGQDNDGVLVRGLQLLLDTGQGGLIISQSGATAGAVDGGCLGSQGLWQPGFGGSSPGHDQRTPGHDARLRRCGAAGSGC